MYAFDMDGVLLDTKRAVMEAYGRAGVVMPEEAWGLPAQEWLFKAGDRMENMRLHAEKTRHYANTLIEYGRVLPMLEVAIKLLDMKQDVVVLTGASDSAVKTVMHCIPQMRRFASKIHTGMSVEAKINYLLLRPRGIYFDDKQDVLTRMQGLLSNWGFVCVSSP